jgi:hypothetical protein
MFFPAFSDLSDCVPLKITVPRYVVASDAQPRGVAGVAALKLWGWRVRVETTSFRQLVALGQTRQKSPLLVDMVKLSIHPSVHRISELPSLVVTRSKLRLLHQPHDVEHIHLRANKASLADGSGEHAWTSPLTSNG